MLCLRLSSATTFSLKDEPIPVPKSNETLIRVRAVGICGSDLHWFKEGAIGSDQLNRPLVLGHEICAETKEGVLVAVDPAVSCGNCEYCVRGDPNLCHSVRFAGHGNIDGAMREYIAWDSNALYPLPSSLTAEDGAMLEPLGVAIHAVRLAKVKPGQTAAVFGSGPIGLLVIQLLRLEKVDVLLATDRLTHRAQAATSFGARNGVPVTGTFPEYQLQEIIGDNGVDIAFEVAGNNDAVRDAINSVRPGGKVILIGIPNDDLTTFPASAARRKGLTIKLVRRMKHTYPLAIELAADQRIDLRTIVTARFKLSEYEKAFNTATKRDGLKVIITP